MEGKVGLYKKWVAWKEKHLHRPSAQLGIAELIFAPFVLLIPLHKSIDWNLFWKYPVGVGDPSPWGISLLFLGIGLFFLVHSIGNLRNAKAAVILSGVIGLVLLCVSIFACWNRVRYTSFPEGRGWAVAADYNNYLIGWVYLLTLMCWGGNLAREGKLRLWPKQSMDSQTQ